MKYALLVFLSIFSIISQAAEYVRPRHYSPLVPDWMKPYCEAIMESAPLGLHQWERENAEFAGLNGNYTNITDHVMASKPGAVALILLQKGLEFDFSETENDGKPVWRPSRELFQVFADQVRILGRDIQAIKLKNWDYMYWYVLIFEASTALRHAPATLRTPIPFDVYQNLLLRFTSMQKEAILLAHLSGSGEDVPDWSDSSTPQLEHIERMKILSAAGFTGGEARIIATALTRTRAIRRIIKQIYFTQREATGKITKASIDAVSGLMRPTDFTNHVN